MAGQIRDIANPILFNRHFIVIEEMSKKMYPTVTKKVDSILQYDLPILRQNGSGAYISFNAFDPSIGKMRRKRIKLNHVKGLTAQRTYARHLINRLIEQLTRGWNPWIASDTTNLMLFKDAITKYEDFVEKMFADSLYRKETYVGYKSYIKILREYASSNNKIYYLYQFDKAYCTEFLDYIFIERGNCAQTRNNYLNFLRVFSGFLVEKSLLKSRPTDGISPISKRLYNKGRRIIPQTEIKRIAEWLDDHDRHFLFACELLYYCFIRPVEMTRLRVCDINVKQCTITISAESSKNKKKQTVTLPKKALHLAIDLGILSAPSNYYIFSDALLPGISQIDTKIFRDHWAKLRKALHLKSEYKFYSLKDTGITEMCDNNMPSITVRDQARHSSLSITDIYTRHGSSANKDIIDLDGAL